MDLHHLYKFFYAADLGYLNDLNDLNDPQLDKTSVRNAMVGSLTLL